MTKATGSAGGVTYTNQGALRNLPVDDALFQAINAAVEAVYGPGYDAQIFSGAQGEHDGQQSRGTTGSRRHTTGVAADVWITDPNGRRLTESQTVPLAEYWLARNIGSAGVSTNNAGKGLHLDLVGGNGPGSVPLGKGETRFWFYGGGTPDIRKTLDAAVTTGRTAPRPPANIPGPPNPATMSPRLADSRIPPEPAPRLASRMPGAVPWPTANTAQPNTKMAYAPEAPPPSVGGKLSLIHI